jgi:predicted O-methyltransferase YrrM
MAWKLLKQGGIMVFDDYLWGDPRVPLRRPKMAIDAFMNIYAAEINVMNIGLQMAIKKVVMP